MDAGRAWTIILMFVILTTALSMLIAWQVGVTMWAIASALVIVALFKENR